MIGGHGFAPASSTVALTNVTLPYIISIASKGWEQACDENQGLKKGLNIVKGEVVYPEIIEAFDLVN